MRRRYEIVDEFVNWAFYSKPVEGLKPEEVYTCYLIWCELFKHEPMKKFAFIEEWNNYIY